MPRQPFELPLRLHADNNVQSLGVAFGKVPLPIGTLPFCR
jgi:hypothetical protein